MSKLVSTFYKNQDLLYKLLVVCVSTALIVYFFPKSGKFQYELAQGFPWPYENLYADEDFAILKSESALAQERDAIQNDGVLYFIEDTARKQRVFNSLPAAMGGHILDSTAVNDLNALHTFARNTLENLYARGVLGQVQDFSSTRRAVLRAGAKGREVAFNTLITVDEVPTFLENAINSAGLAEDKQALLQVFYDIVEPTLRYDPELTEAEMEVALKNIVLTRGAVTKGSRIVEKGEILEGETYQKLRSLKAKYEAQSWSDSKYYWILSGYILLVLLALIMLLLFLRNYRITVFSNNTKVTFIYFNIILMVLLTTAVVKYRPDYVYVVPLCILPLIFKAFFDARLGLFSHVITVLLLGFIVPNSFEYVFLQVIAGIVTILTISELYKRANLFISVGQITLVYIVAYFAFYIIHQGGLEGISWDTFAMFLIAGLATLFVQPLIYIYEKIFGLVSDVSLLELSDTNSKLLKKLADIAPGTFHHSLNVANLSEAAANEIGANAMLARVGALYHDIGKMQNPSDFTENQASGFNAHDDYEPETSARIIIDHVINGIEIARKNNLPDRVIDFIRTHHGTSLVHYFYMKAKEQNETVSPEKFQYPGPLPFSKETAILMMADSVEAASKSLKNPTSQLIDAFVEKIVDKQKDEGQFLNADITFKEIQIIKKVLKKKLINIYHLRVEYPD